MVVQHPRSLQLTGQEVLHSQMLESLSIKNFQIHEDFKVQLDSLVTCFVGESDAGKSAILRALRWLCINKPSGDAFLTHGRDFTRVRLKLDSHEIVREKGSAGNHYYLNGKELTAFGTGVPDEIQNILNVGDVNFQSQLSPIWWLSLTPGEVSKQLNAIVNLDQIDSVLADIASEVRKSRTTVQVSEERLSKAKEERERLSWVEEAEKEYQLAEQLYEDWQQTTQECVRINDLLEEGRKAQVTVENAATLVQELGNATRIGGRVIELGKEADELENLIEDIHKARRQMIETQVEMNEAKEELEKLMVGNCPVCGHLIH